MAKNNLRPLPEVLTRKDSPGAEWKVEAGPCRRGEAWTNHTNKIMRVPVTDTPQARAVRAHEMMHAKVSPNQPSDGHMAILSEYGQRLVECAEELRVNTLTARAGFNLSDLADGSEYKSGTDVQHIKTPQQEADGFNETLLFAASQIGARTSYEDFMRGVREFRPDMAEEIERVCNEVKRFLNNCSTPDLADTTPDLHDGAPLGFRYGVRGIAEILANHTKTPELDEDEAINEPEDSYKPEGEGEEDEREASETKIVSKRPVAKSVWDPMRILKLSLTVNICADKLGRKYVPAISGTRVRYPTRYLTDPGRRVFGNYKPAAGGVILVDQSGSMSFEVKDMDAILAISPSLTIIGYSSAGRNIGTNVWVMAEGGKRCTVEDMPRGNGGNGVDGPALKFAESKRKKGEPLIWITDGLNEGPSECAKFVHLHNVHMVYDTLDLMAAIKKGAAHCKKTRYVGRATSGYAIRMGYTTEAQVQANNEQWVD
jgi:hypothetical protein